MSKLKLKEGRVQQKLKTREAILLTAQSLMESTTDFTLEDIAEHADISRATVYRYFSNVDVLCAEAALNLHVKSTNDLLEEVKHLNMHETLIHIQEYFNQLASDHEMAFRKYLSVVLDESTQNENQKTTLRGARRPVVLEAAMQPYLKNMSPETSSNLMYIVTVLSGIEALVANKDVNGLDNDESSHLLQWALEMILKSLNSQ